MVRVCLFTVMFFGAAASYSGSVSAAMLDCPPGELSFEMVRKTFVPQDTYTAHLYGIFDVPSPHTYRLIFNEDKQGVHYKRGTLVLEPAKSIKEEQGASGSDDLQIDGEQENGTLEVKERFETLPLTEGLFIDVVKQASFGNEYIEYYKVKFSDIEVENKSQEDGRLMACLKPELYK